MTEAEEGAGAALAWRLLATLEGGALLLAAAALGLHAVRRRVGIQSTPLIDGQRARRVLVTNNTSHLGREIIKRLESRGCIVSTVTSNATSLATSGADERVDALIVIGSEAKADGLTGLSGIVSEDVFDNLKLLDDQVGRVMEGGRVVWISCTGEVNSGAFRGATDAFDDLVKTQLERVATASQCEPLWLGRQRTVERAVMSVIAALMPSEVGPDEDNEGSKFSIRSVVVKFSNILWRWLKMIK